MKRSPHNLPTASPDKDQLRQLAISASAGDIQVFNKMANSINWSQHEPSEMVDTIRLALSIGAFDTAQRLAKMGTLVFPSDSDLTKLAYVLAPPSATVSIKKTSESSRKNREWLKNNRSNFAGQWVALKAGNLIANATTLSQLNEIVAHQDGMMITRV